MTIQDINTAKVQGSVSDLLKQSIQYGHGAVAALDRIATMFRNIQGLELNGEAANVGDMMIIGCDVAMYYRDATEEKLEEIEKHYRCLTKENQGGTQ